jgi:hypothetical protein
MGLNGFEYGAGICYHSKNHRKARTNIIKHATRVWDHGCKSTLGVTFLSNISSIILLQKPPLPDVVLANK